MAPSTREQLGVLTLGGDVTTNASASGALIAGNLTLGASRNFTVANGSAAQDLTVSANIAAGMNQNLTKAGAGVMVVSGNNTYTALTNVNAGTFIAAHANALGTSFGGTSVASGATLAFAGGITIVNESFVISGNGDAGVGALYNAAGDNTLSGAILLGGNARIGAVDGSDFTVNGVIRDNSSTFGIEINAAANGTVILGGNNTFDGAVTVAEGILQATHSNALGAAVSSTTITVEYGATLELTGGITIPATKTLAISGLPVADTSKIMSVSGDNTIQGDIGITGGNNVAFDVAGGTTLTVSGVISGSLDFDKNNTGTLILTGTNTNTGNVNVGDGTLMVNGSLATGELGLRRRHPGRLGHAPGRHDLEHRHALPGQLAGPPDHRQPHVPEQRLDLRRADRRHDRGNGVRPGRRDRDGGPGGGHALPLAGLHAGDRHRVHDHQQRRLRRGRRDVQRPGRGLDDHHRHRDLHHQLRRRLEQQRRGPDDHRRHLHLGRRRRRRQPLVVARQLGRRCRPDRRRPSGLPLGRDAARATSTTSPPASTSTRSSSTPPATASRATTST